MESDRIIDFHAHAFPDELASRAVDTINTNIPPDAHAILDGTIGALLTSMDAAGVAVSVICSIATAPKQVNPILQWSLSIESDRIVPFGSVHPDCADSGGEVIGLAAAGLRGVKLHPLYQGFAADDVRVWPLYAAVEESRMVLLMHAGRDIAFPPDDDRAAPARIVRVHEAFPGIPLVAAHLGGWRMWDEVADVLAGTPVYLETSFSIGFSDDPAIERVLDRHPVERIVFGTDTPWRDQARAIADVRAAFPDEADQRLVLHDNAARLLDGPA